MTAAHESVATPLRISVLAPLGGAAITAFGVFVDAQAAVLIFAVFALAGAIARRVTPTSRAFSVRSRGVDVAVLGFLGLALALLGLTTPLG